MNGFSILVARNTSARLLSRHERDTGELRAERDRNRDFWALALAALLGVVALVAARLPKILYTFGIGE